MGLLQRAIETYDAMQHLVGVEIEGKEVLAPIGHITTKATIEITLDQDGKFIQARSIEQKIILPVTEESSGRTSAPAPHPLDEQLTYLTGQDEKKLELYLSGLKGWMESTYTDDKVKAVYAYVSRHTISTDLNAAGLLKYDDKGKLKNDKDMVCWIVLGLGERSGPVWKDTVLMQKYSAYYLSIKASECETLCMLSGEKTVAAKQHLKGVMSLNGNAKIISSNDSVNFTYRGRFEKDSEALSIGYISSQKAHNALKWIISNECSLIGGRAFVCWNPHGYQVPKISSPLLKRSESKPNPTQYHEELNKALYGYRSALPKGSDVIIAAFDAATTGRLAVTYYNELSSSDFLDRLEYWDSTCCWYDSGWGTSSPSLYTIINYAFGTERSSGKVETDDKVVSQHMQRLMLCRIDASAMPRDIVTALVHRAGNPLAYSPANRRQLLFTACAVISQYRHDVFKEEINMALDPEKNDRSYQFGRLLAVMEKAERDTYDSDEKRETNAIRMQSVFVQRPGYASKIVLDQLKTGYYPRLSVGSRVYYDRLIGEIMEVISRFDADYNKPLTETYLLGYYLQKNALYTHKGNNENMEDTENEA